MVPVKCLSLLCTLSISPYSLRPWNFRSSLPQPIQFETPLSLSSFYPRLTPRLSRWVSLFEELRSLDTILQEERCRTSTPRMKIRAHDLPCPKLIANLYAIVGAPTRIQLLASTSTTIAALEKIPRPLRQTQIRHLNDGFARGMLTQLDSAAIAKAMLREERV